MYRAGIAAIFSQLVREDRLHVVESFAVDAPKTKLVASALKGMGVSDALIVTDSVDNNLFLAARNPAASRCCRGTMSTGQPDSRSTACCSPRPLSPRLRSHTNESKSFDDRSPPR